jgi:hypothetical protein
MDIKDGGRKVKKRQASELADSISLFFLTTRCKKTPLRREPQKGSERSDRLRFLSYLF